MLNANFVIQALEAISPAERTQVQKYLNFCASPTTPTKAEVETLRAEHATPAILRKLIIATRNIKPVPSTQVQ